MTEMVTQADRYAFLDFLGMRGRMPETMAAKGAWDNDPRMHILARHRIEATRDPEAKLAEARRVIENVEQSLAQSERVSDLAAYSGEDVAVVGQLGKRIGFGALMDIASSVWRIRLNVDGIAGGEFVPGPCRSTVTSIRLAARAFLASLEGANDAKQG